MAKEFAEFRERLYPLMMDLAQIQEKGEGGMVNGPVADGLFVIYGIEEPGDKIRYVTYQDLRDWGVTHTTVHVTAVRNLQRKTAGARFNKLDTPQGDRPMFIWHLEDGYDAARILLPDWLAEFGDAVPGRLVLGVPHRNWLVAFGDADPELVRVVKRRVESEHHSADFPVSPFLYTWTGAGLVRYLPGRGEAGAGV
jgi:hypothetical protein